jgi:hypothetical protein
MIIFLKLNLYSELFYDLKLKNRLKTLKECENNKTKYVTKSTL